ncbi:MAG TPA: XrtA/PEP-CTERM system exopolysaccharide export protein [Acetobacteraceae bacterium]|jgi:polysaccharide biosynthesis/export protein|nr:XrtA/PEP-CTERM system exopolysaccharide export protein [Acetobacteraceae bacterium]
MILLPRAGSARLMAIVSLTACVLLAACGPALPPSAAANANAAAGSPGSTKGDEYVIGAGDSLSVFVYRNPDLSEPGVAVRPDGRISTPLIDDLTAAGKTPTQLAHEIEDRLKKYIQDPTVTVIVRSFVGPADRQIKVIGEATDPQALPYRDGMTLLDVMIATKGLTKYAAGNRAVIIRRDAAGKQESIHVSLSDLMKYGDITKNVAMQPGDTLIIPQSWF